LPQLLDCGLVFAQIKLCADQEDGRRRRMMMKLGIPLARRYIGPITHGIRTRTHFSPDILITRWADNGETNQEDVGLGV
jgi:hypothetical protein